MIDWRCVRWEVRLMLRERLLPIVCLTLVLAALMATLNGYALVRQWSAVSDRFAASAADSDATLARALKLGSKPGGEEAGSLRTTYIRPMPPLLGLVAGRAMLDPIAATVGPTDQIYHLFRDYQTDNPWTLAIGRFDWAFLLAVILPLLIIALGYDILARDRDLGVDRQLALDGGGEGRLLAARIVARATPLGLFVLILVVVASVVTGSAGVGGYRLLALLGLAMGGMLFWWGLIALVSLSRWSAVRTAATLLGIWAMLAFVVPSLVNAAAQTIAPPPSRIELTTAARQAEIAAQGNADMLADAYRARRPGFPQDRDDAARRADARFAISVEIDRVTAPALDRFNAALARQQRLAGILQFLSPVGAEQALMTEVAGTSHSTRALFQAQANGHYSLWRDALALFQFAGAKLTSARIESLPRISRTGPPPVPVAALVIFMAIASVPAACSIILARQRRQGAGRRAGDGRQAIMPCVA